MPEEHVTGFDREIAALLAVDPPPDFAAGVRARIASTRTSHHGFAWAVAAAALVILGAGTAVLWVASDRSVPAVPRPASTNVVGAVRPRAPEPMPAPPPRTMAATRVGTRHARQVEVIIDPAFNQAVRRLLRAAQREHVEAAVAQPDTPPAELVIVPVPVEELPIPVIKVTEPRSLSR